MMTTEFWKKYFKVYDVLNLCIPYQELIGNLVAALDPKPDERILDAGGGTGNVAVKLAELGADVTVYDFSKEAIEICKKKNSKIQTICGDLTEKLPFPDNYFDKAISNNTIYAIRPEKRDEVISEIYRVLKPGGRLVVSNIIEGFKPLRIYEEHIKSAVKKDGFLDTAIVLTKMLWPTIKMFYYNANIKKENKSGRYAFFKLNEQKILLRKNGFKDIPSDTLVYAKQGILNIAIK